MKKKLSKTHKRETVGQTVYDNLHKQPDVTDLKEIKPDLQQEYYDQMINTIKNAHEKITGRIFYLEIIFLREKPLLQQVIHPRYIARSSCPSPTWGQHAWEYDTLTQKLDLLWAIPFKDKADELKRNIAKLTDGEKISLREVLNFDNGTYEMLARKLNNEPEDGDNRILINNEVQA